MLFRSQPLPELPKAQQDARPGAILDRLGPLGVGLEGEGPRRGLAALSEPDETDEVLPPSASRAHPATDLTDLLRPAYEALARR